MKEYTFDVGNKPRVVIQRVRGDVQVQPWRERVIRVRIAGENEDGSVTEPYRENDTIFINDCNGSVGLYVPYEKNAFGTSSLTTDISITDLEGSVSMDHVGHVEVTNISGEVRLSHTQGSLRAVHAPVVVEDKGVGGNATLEDVARVEIRGIGGSLDVTHAGIVKVGAAGGSARATAIGELFACGSTGGSCEIHDSGNAEVSISNVGGSLLLERVARMSSCNVGGSLTAPIFVGRHDRKNFTVGGSANLSLPRNANLQMRVMAGGSISGEAVNKKCHNMATLTYGNGESSLNVTAGGSVKLSWTSDPDDRTGGDEQAPPSKAQRRQAILTMVQQGRITPDEGNVLLEALG